MVAILYFARLPHILTLTFMRMDFFFPNAENESSISDKKKKCLKICLIEKLCCVCFSFCVRVCVGVSGPNIFDILITCRIGNAASERHALWNCEECPIQGLSGTICVSLKMWAPWKALSLRQNLASHMLPNRGYVVRGVFFCALPCKPVRGWLTEQASSI